MQGESLFNPSIFKLNAPFIIPIYRIEFSKSFADISGESSNDSAATRSFPRARYISEYATVASAYHSQASSSMPPDPTFSGDATMAVPPAGSSHVVIRHSSGLPVGESRSLGHPHSLEFDMPQTKAHGGVIALDDNPTKDEGHSTAPSNTGSSAHFRRYHSHR